MISIGDHNNMDPLQDHPVVQLSSTYPLAPMEYVNMYSNENIKLGRAPLPPPIIKDNYSCFGKTIDPNDVLIRSLDQQGIQRLYASQDKATTPSGTSGQDTATIPRLNINNHKKELKKLNHSILIAYLDLLEILVKSPNTQLPLDQQQIDVNNQQCTFKTMRDQKLEDIELLFINMHHLINELRPHQARDNIRCILEMQKRQRLETAIKFKKHLFKIVDLLKVCINSIHSSNSNLVEIQGEESKKPSKFLDELNSLISNATNLTNSLSSIEQASKSSSNKKNDLNLATDSNDIEMEFTEGSDSNNNTSKVGGSENSRCMTKNSLQMGNCDFKDLFLCNLIDDFLLKENEF